MHVSSFTISTIATRPGGRIRVCGDFKSTLNPVLQNEEYPMPTADELFNQMQGGTRFSKIALSRAYLQVELDEEAEKFYVMNTAKGLRQYTRMPYGIKPASGIFQKVIESQSKTIVNIDDILISESNDVEHLENLQKVFEILENRGVTRNKEKCRFFEEEVEYDGFMINRDGVRTNPKKVQAVSDGPAPKNIKELCSSGETTFHITKQRHGMGVL